MQPFSTMDCPPDVFFTEAAFEQYSVQPTFLEILEKYAPKRAEAGKGKQTRNEKGITEATSNKQQGLHVTLSSPKPEVRYPRYSSLTHDQHRKYLQLQAKYSQHSLQGRHTAQELHDLREFRQYQTNVANEQREFQQFAERVARNSPDDYGYLHLLAQAYMKRVLGCWCEHLKRYPRHYALYQTIGISVDPVIPSDPVLKHMAHLITLGQAFQMTVPEVDPNNQPTLHQMVSVKEGSSKESEEDSVQVVSNDINAKKLAAKYQASIVVSYSSLEILLGTHAPSFEQQWEIPITVTTHNQKGDGASSPAANTIYIDKPLKPKRIFPHEASAVFHKAVLKGMLFTDSKSTVVVDSSDELVKRFLQGEGSGGSALDSLDFGEVSCADALMELETFGSGLMLPFPKQTNQCKDGKISNIKSKEGTSGKVITSTGTSDSITSPTTEDSKDQQAVDNDNQVCNQSQTGVCNQSQTGDISRLSNKTLLSANKDDLGSLQDSPQSQNSANKMQSINQLLDPSKEIYAINIRDSPLSPGSNIDTEVNVSLNKSPSHDRTQDNKPNVTESKEVDSCKTGTELSLDTPLSPDSNIDPEVNNSPNKNASHDRTQVNKPNVTESKNVDKKGTQLSLGSAVQNEQLKQYGVNESESTQYGARLPASGKKACSVTQELDTIGDKNSIPHAMERKDQIQTEDDSCSSKVIQSHNIRDSPLSPDSNIDTEVNISLNKSPSHDRIQVDRPNPTELKEVDSCKKGVQLSSDSTAAMTSVSPSSPSNLSKIERKPLKGEQDGKSKSPQESGLVSPSKHNNPCTLKDSSASEYEGDLVIASAHEDDSAGDGIVNKASPSKLPIKKPEDLSTATKDKTMQSSPSTVRTRRSRRLEISMTSEESEEDGNVGVVTQRRSARLRKADASPSDRTPVSAKKVKKKARKDNVGEHSEDKEAKVAVQHETENVPDAKDTGSTQDSGNEKLLSIASDSEKDNTPVSKNSEKEDTKQMQSSKSTPKISGKSPQNNATKRSASTALTNSKSNLVSKKPRTRNTSKDQPQSSGGKLGGMSSTIDTIMKLQEALHTRRQQKIPNESPRAKAANKGETKRNLAVEEDPADYQLPQEGNMCYNLWKLGKMNILVRTRDHGEVMHGDNQQRLPVTVIPKMEYQAYFGYEQPGLGELCHIWANLYCRPGSKAIRGHVNAMTSQLMKLDWLDLNSPLWFQCPLNPARSMKLVHAIFDKLQGLPEGKYLLSHNPGDTHVCVHLALEPGSKKRVTYDLYSAHDAPALQPSPPKVLPWMPLDPKVPLHRYIEQSTIPLTFPPRLPGMKMKPHGPSTSAKKKGKNKKSNILTQRAAKSSPP